MDPRITLKMVKEINSIENKAKKIECAVAALTVQVDIEDVRKTKRELETAWILGQGRYPE
jgi:hypothetical protein